MSYDTTFIKKVLMMARNAYTEQIGCDACWEEVDRFAEMTLAGKNAAEALPLVEAHLKGCGECGAEYQALLDSLRETTSRSSMLEPV